MKSTEMNKSKETHSNRLLISVTISLALLAVLLLIHKGQSYFHTILGTQTAVLVLCIISAVATVLLTVLAVVKKKTFLVEYIIVAAIMTFCFYCLHGVGFVTIKLMKYVTAAILIAYLGVSLVYHTIAPKLLKK